MKETHNLVAKEMLNLLKFFSLLTDNFLLVATEISFSIGYDRFRKLWLDIKGRTSGQWLLKYKWRIIKEEIRFWGYTVVDHRKIMGKEKEAL